MIRLAIIDQEGKVLSLKDVPTAAELLHLAEQARNIIRECEQLARDRGTKGPANKQGGMPYLT
jgi:hypothetical protein